MNEECTDEFFMVKLCDIGLIKLLLVAYYYEDMN